MAKRKLTGWARALESAAVHSFAAASRRAKKGWATRRKKAREAERITRGAVRYTPEERIPHIPTVAEQAGVDEALDVARTWGIHPDEWADELAEDFDYETHSLYDEYFYPAAGSGAW